MLVFSLFDFCDETPTQQAQASRQLDFVFVLNWIFFRSHWSSSRICTSHTLKSYLINQVFWINLNQDWLLLMLIHLFGLCSERKEEAEISERSAFCFFFIVIWDTKLSLSHFLQAYRRGVSGQMLLIMATSWHYWYIPAGRWCNKNMGRQHSGSWGGCLVLTSQPSPALRLVDYTELQLSQRRLKPAGCLPKEQRWQVLFFWSPPCPRGTYFGWRCLTEFWSPQMLRSVWAKTQNPLMLKVCSINNYSLCM